MSRPVQVLSLGLESAALEAVRASLQSSEFKLVGKIEEWDQLIAEGENGAAFDLVICGSQPFGVESIEAAQTFRSICPAAKIFYVSTTALDLKVRELTKNGFHEVFLLPQDRRMLQDSLIPIERTIAGSGRRVFRPVSLVDVGAGDPLSFDVSIFLPINNKYVKVLNSGKALSKDKIDRFNSFQVSKIFIDSEKIQDFYKYSAQRLKSLATGGDKSVSETERLERLHDSLRRLTLNIFDTSQESSFDEGRQMMEDTQKIVGQMVGLESVQNIHSELSKALKLPGDSTSRGERVSTFAALFEMAAGLGKTQAAAIAGLFLDIGLASLPAELVKMDWRKMSDEQRKIYQTHPDLSVKLLMSKKMVVPPDVQKAILQHHERLDGSGFPDKVSGTKIAPLSQIVAFADRFEALLFGADQRPMVDDVMNQLRGENLIQMDLFNAISSLVRKEKKAS